MTDEEMLVGLKHIGKRVSLPCPDGLEGCLVHHFGIETDPVAARAIDRIEELKAENERLRKALEVYAGPMEWTQEGGWGMFPVWADGYPGGVYLDDNTLDFGEAARAALQETEQ
jgi:hypothetical protein